MNPSKKTEKHKTMETKLNRMINFLGMIKSEIFGTLIAASWIWDISAMEMVFSYRNWTLDLIGSFRLDSFIKKSVGSPINKHIILSYQWASLIL